MITMSIYDDECAELIFNYVVVERFDEWCQVVDTHPDVTLLEFAVTNYDDFREWAKNRDFIVTLDRES